jgi:hypothetical protein
MCIAASLYVCNKIKNLWQRRPSLMNACLHFCSQLAEERAVYGSLPLLLHRDLCSPLCMATALATLQCPGEQTAGTISSGFFWQIVLDSSCLTVYAVIGQVFFIRPAGPSHRSQEACQPIDEIIQTNGI